ncbi:hypothetical protein, partial [Bordetella pertussis]
ASTPPRHRARCTHLQTQPGRIQPIDSSHLGKATRKCCSPFACIEIASSGAKRSSESNCFWRPPSAVSKDGFWWYWTQMTTARPP